MSFSIQTNVNSLIAQENLRVNSNFQSMTIQRLTSGYRINSSGDDNLDYQSILSAQQLTKTYQRLVKNRQVLDTVAANNDFGLTAGEIGDRVHAGTTVIAEEPA